MLNCALVVENVASIFIFHGSVHRVILRIVGTVYCTVIGESNPVGRKTLPNIRSQFQSTVQYVHGAKSARTKKQKPCLLSNGQGYWHAINLVVSIATY